MVSKIKSLINVTLEYQIKGDKSAFGLRSSKPLSLFIAKLPIFFFFLEN